MTRSQAYINALMENVSEGQLASDEFRVVFGRIRERLTEGEDFDHELRALYKVTGLGDFALSLMWIAEQVDQNPSKTEYTPEEQAFVLDLFRAAVGDTSVAPLEETPQTPEPVEESPPAAPVEAPAEDVFAGPPPEQPVEESVEMPQNLQMETSGRIDESEKAIYAAPPGPASDSQGNFPGLMEQFVEAMQSGSDDREQLLTSVLQESNVITPMGSGAPDDLRDFCQYLVEFLTYIRENGFMDDVRVMNILSNVSSPVASWAEAPPDAREGRLAEGIEILRTFKSLFE